uniref:Uncharacterized protein n=1 Tax=Romanomermis culicivorax TaxID=13658 RepID=A0A915JA11_ROMCU
MLTICQFKNLFDRLPFNTSGCFLSAIKRQCGGRMYNLPVRGIAANERVILLLTIIVVGRTRDAKVRQMDDETKKNLKYSNHFDKPAKLKAYATANHNHPFVNEPKFVDEILDDISSVN